MTDAELSGDAPRQRSAGEALAALSVLTSRLGRCGDLDEVVTESLDAMAGLFGFEHSMLLMLDESGTRLYTIASRGYERAGIGSEVGVGEGIIGTVAAEARPMRVGNIQRMMIYARMARRRAEADIAADRTEIPLPGLPSAQSQLGVPAMVMGQLLGVLAVESERLGAFTSEDEHLLGVVAHLVASAIELDRVGGRSLVAPDLAGPGSPVRQGDGPELPGIGAQPESAPSLGRTSVVRFFSADGSTFVDGEYLIKGVPGRILWRLLRDYVDQGRTDFSNREVRLDPSLELPAFRDNLESRLILLKRRLDERQAPMRIDKTGRGRFRLVVDGAIVIQRADGP